ncbi:sulfite reductase flavoprotein subunit alpha [Alteromonas sp. 5E99-2]|uniref:diflavin oxidoreductase n=1 Tax=Alteromonas sp. 5E99-2 TaxID=2817683 RepID=UPI001A98BB43|nr:sulfite reductase flavoprotein subunit alpha [Alteromonas sp. 5E99-2]MBO1255952.1 sulfite reductase flavoprotein subunit alpha [Alteromonas sp. 5E99-2]
MPNIYIAYGSESGNSLRLAHTLKEKLTTHGMSTFDITSINDCAVSTLSKDDILFLVTSSFGDGEPPANAATLHQQLLANISVECQFAVFGLGDVSYPKFCGFSIELNELLTKSGATAIAQRVDADVDYLPFFEQWSDAIIKHLSGHPEPLKKLTLQVKPYDEKHAFSAKIKSITPLNKGDFPAYDINFDIANSGINYLAGDLLYVLPPVNPLAIERVVLFYGVVSDSQRKLLATKELKRLNKPLIRALAKITNSKALKALTKMSATSQLTEYCYGRDLADLLTDYCSIETLPLDELLTVLAEPSPRAYSIASCGKASADTVRICIREVNYYRGAQQYTGTVSHFLAKSKVGSRVNIYTRSNPHFHLPDDTKKPLILIAAGVGIAPHIGFLASKRQADTHLFFGERYAKNDFFYEDELKHFIDTKHLTHIHTAFSRDQTQKMYVQNKIREQGELIWALILQGAEIYICGSKAKLDKSIDSELTDIAIKFGAMSESNAKQWLLQLVSDSRYHKDLY